jgi:hypothetical protein
MLENKLYFLVTHFPTNSILTNIMFPDIIHRPVFI